MIQEMTWVKKNGMKIRGKMYLPETGNGKYPVVIFSHGFNSNYRELMHHGDGFASAGLCCLFFDFCGGGRDCLSDGIMEKMTIGSECEDLKVVISSLKSLDYVDSERIFLLGESMGGLVSALVAADCQEEIRAMVLWYPAFVIPDDARKRREAGIREVFGVRQSENFDKEAMEIDVYRELGRYHKPVLIIHGDADSVVPIRYSEKALSLCPNARLTVMRGAAHGYHGADSTAAREQSICFIRENL